MIYIFIFIINFFLSKMERLSVPPHSATKTAMPEMRKSVLWFSWEEQVAVNFPTEVLAPLTDPIDETRDIVRNYVLYCTVRIFSRHIL